jgi:hypothetical protein
MKFSKDYSKRIGFNFLNKPFVKFKRFYMGLFADGFRQDIIDVILGNYKSTWNIDDLTTRNPKETRYILLAQQRLIPRKISNFMDLVVAFFWVLGIYMIRILFKSRKIVLKQSKSHHLDDANSLDQLK